MKQWRRDLAEALRGPLAPRVVSFSKISELADANKEGVNVKSVRRFVESAEEMGLLQPVRKGLWLNPMAFPAPSPADAAAFIRSGAVVSLQTVLGDAGVLNNYASQVFAVIPSRPGAARPSTGDVEAAGTIYRFSAISQAILEAGDEEDRLVPMMHYARATPEAALVHWIYLAHCPQSRMRMPDTQCDVSFLDEDRVERLASLAGVREEALSWMEQCREREVYDDEQIGWYGGPR